MTFNKLQSALFLILIVSSLYGQNKNTYHVIDDMNNVIQFSSPPERVITLAPNLTEMIFELGAENKLVGNTLYCSFPEAAKDIEKVGDLLTFDYEKIFSLSPDLIFITVEGNTKAAYDRFLELGLKVFVSNPRSYEGIKKSYLELGKIFNKEREAENKVALWDSKVNDIQSRGENLTPQTVMFIIETNPIMLAGKNTFLNEFIRLCGMKNLTGDSEINYPVYSREEILIRDPYYIVYPTGGKRDISLLTGNYPEWKNLSAVIHNRVIFLNWDLFSRPGPRFVEALEVLFANLHP